MFPGQVGGSCASSSSTSSPATPQAAARLRLTAVVATKAEEPLPPGWGTSVAPNGRVFYIDHNSRITTWVGLDLYGHLFLLCTSRFVRTLFLLAGLELYGHLFLLFRFRLLRTPFFTVQVLNCTNTFFYCAGLESYRHLFRRQA